MEVLHNLRFSSKEKQDFHAFYEVSMCNTESTKERTKKKKIPPTKTINLKRCRGPLLTATLRTVKLILCATESSNIPGKRCQE